MNLKFALRQTILLISIFLLTNILLFIPNYYSLQFNTNICDNVNDGDFSTENLPRTQEYYSESCDSVVKAWEHTLTPPPTFRYHFVPLVMAGLITGLYSYYLVLREDYDSKGVKNWE